MNHVSILQNKFCQLNCYIERKISRYFGLQKFNGLSVVPTSVIYLFCIRFPLVNNILRQFSLITSPLIIFLPYICTCSCIPQSQMYHSYREGRNIQLSQLRHVLRVCLPNPYLSNIYTYIIIKHKTGSIEDLPWKVLDQVCTTSVPKYLSVYKK